MSGSAQRYAVLVNGDPPDFITERYGNYGDIYVQLLRDPAREEVWDVFRAFEGSFPEEADIASYDTLIFTGSKYDAYKDEDWIVRCREIIIQAHARKQKILGICFGAQLLATALSGRVAPSNQGMQMGAVKCTLVADDVMLRYLLDASSSFVINQIHRDEIQALPAGARLLASSKYCPVEAFAIEDHILATQGHPEFTKVRW
mmetsp:Transcript_14927/g.38320  ORF Transcript_14927/g.38320 Transcript_14927/m.38320 type:complete len:202 (-) Transcript_14927:2300-2905(-)